MDRIELLAPAGSFEALAAAVESGADAVYLGGTKFNARAFADNFDNDTLIKAVDYAHLRGVKVYITVNILIFDRELEEVLDYIRFLYCIGVDAVIVQDFALVRLVKEWFPGLEVHCSTQMVIHNSAGAEFYKKLGADRIVLARELSLDEVRGIIDKTGIDTEIFIHGALCVSYSGQCLMSSMIGGRSGNRGRCAQPCRRAYSFYDFGKDSTVEQYKKKHLLSTRDLNTYMRLEEIVASGVKSLKIEGRMKKPEYVATVVKHYRDALDCILGGKKGQKSKNAEYELEIAFNREFTEGYLFGNRNKDIVSIERPDNRGIYLGKVVKQQGDIASILIEKGLLNDGDGIEIVEGSGKSKGTLVSGIRVKGKNVKTAVKGDTADIFLRSKVTVGARVNKTFDSMLNKKAKEQYSAENTRKIPVSMKLYAEAGSAPRIEISDRDGNIISYSADESAEKAQKAATQTDKAIEQLGKTGDTPYIAEVIKADIGDDCFLPARLLNQLRREGLKLLSQARIESHRREKPSFDIKQELKKTLEDSQKPTTERIETIAGIRDFKSAEAASKAGADTIYILSEVYNGNIERDAADFKRLCLETGVSLYYVMPVITRDYEQERVEKHLKELLNIMEPIKLGVVVSNSGQFEMLERMGIERFRINYTMNVMNSVAASRFAAIGAESVCISPELTLSQIGEMKIIRGKELEAFVYGYLPLMTTEYCPQSLLREGCEFTKSCAGSNYGIIDEKGKKFRILKLNSCRTQILNADVLFVPEELDRIIKAGVGKLRCDFYVESPSEVHDIIALYRNSSSTSDSDKRIISGIKGRGFTKGHYFRGVE